MAALPTDLQTVADALAATARRADSLAARLSDAQFHWQPDEGRAWSVAQCLEHLAKCAALYASRMRHAVDNAARVGNNPGRPIAPTFIGNWFAASQEPPPKRRFKAPAKIRPGAVQGREEIMRAYHVGHAALGDLIRDSARVDVNRTTFANPFAPIIRMRLGTGFMVLAAHERRHLWQAERVTSLPGFPQNAH